MYEESRARSSSCPNCFDGTETDKAGIDFVPLFYIFIFCSVLFFLLESLFLLKLS